MLSYGPRLSFEEYKNRRTQSQTLDLAHRRRAKLNARIDYTLGQDFPIRRRAALWDAYCAHRHRLKMVPHLMTSLTHLLGSQTTNALFTRVLARYGLPMLHHALSEEELLAFCFSEEWL